MEKNLNVCTTSAGNTTPHPASNKPVTTPMEDDSGLFDIKPKIEPSRAMDYDDSKIDDDLDKLLQHIKEEQQNSMVIFLRKMQIKCVKTYLLENYPHGLLLNP